MNKKTILHIDRIFLSCIAFSLGFLGGCDFKNDLCYLDHPHSDRLTIEPEWETGGTGNIPDRLRMLVYRNDNRNLWLDTVVETHEKITLSLPQDYYMMLLFNEDIRPMTLNQPEDYFNAYLQLPDLNTETVKSSSVSSSLTATYRSMYQPGVVFTGNAQIDYRKVLPEKITVPVQQQTKTLAIHLNIDNGIDNIARCNGILSGLASALRLYRGEAIKGNAGFVEFPFSKNYAEQILTGTVLLLDADTEESRYSNLLQMSFQLNNGQTINRSADITQWLSEQINSGKKQFILTLNVSLESDQSGGIIIDDTWGDDIVVPIN